MSNRFIKDKVIGKEVHQWELIKTSSLFKPELKNTNVEIAASYLNAAKCLYKDVKKQQHPDKGLTVLYINSLIIPFLFLCHHSVELAIKVALTDRDIKYGNIHSLKDLFTLLALDVDDKYLELMDTLDLVDDKGMWLRYDRDLKNGDEYLSKPCFVNCKDIIDAIDEFVRILIQ